MQTRWRFALTAACVVAGLGVADAQTLRDIDGPAEIPPASYTGRQYVDSNGCVFVRAGYDGNVSWVPRVTRSRQVLCGYEPTNVAGATPPRATTPAPAPAPAPMQTVRTVPPPAAPAPSAPMGTRVVAPPATIAAAPRTTVPAGGTACPGFDGISATYMRSPSGLPVRCGPQAVHPATGAVQVRPAAPIQVPDGYRPVFEDGRLNPLRGVQTLEGHTQMSLVWTQTVPRRLINPVTGRDLTALYPGLRYPFTTLAEQRAAAAAGDPVRRTLPNGNTVRVRIASGGGGAAVAVDGGARLSTKSVAPETTGGSRWVQVAGFGDRAAADAAAARVGALGLPVRMGRGQRSGMSIVLAGPFTEAGAEAALAQLRGAGFGGAALR